MKKAFFMIRPTEFLTYGEIDKDGQTTYKNSESFEVEDTGENFVIFEAYYEDTYSGRKYQNYVKEMVTGREFDLQVIKAHSKEESDNILINSNEAGLFQERPSRIEDVEVRPIRVSGLFNYFNENKEAAKQYYYELAEFYDNARAFKHIHDNSIGGPSKYLTRCVRRDYKKRNK